APTDRGPPQPDGATPYDAGVPPSCHARHVPHEHADRSARRDVHRHRQSNRGHREGNDELKLLALARLEPLAVAPRGELEARGLADPHEVVSLPPNQGHLLGRGRYASLAGRSSERFDPFEAVIQRRQVPAGALGTDDPEAALPFVERQPPPDAQSGRAPVAVELAVAEGAGAIHQS